MARICQKDRFYRSVHIVGVRRHICAWCDKPIEPGTEYVVATEYPGGDSGYADTAGHPVRMSVHAESPCHYCTQERTND